MQQELGPDFAIEVHHGLSALDMISRDRSWGIEVKGSVQGARDLHAALIQLAMYAAATPAVRRGALVAHAARMTRERALEEWHRAQALMRPEVAARLVVIVLTPTGDATSSPGDPTVERFALAARRAFDAAAGAPSRSKPRPRASWSPKVYEVWKVLLGAWLRRESPLPLHELQRRSGASYPTVSSLLNRLEASGELERTSSRGAGMSGMPRRSLSEVLALSGSLRQTHGFFDRTGRAADPVAVVRRIVSKVGDHAAIGGVEGARHYMPSFNLNGLPRVDVTLAPGTDLRRWVASVDPALAPTSQTDPSAKTALVVHVLGRPEAHFDRSAVTGVAFADPAEVLLDLHEMRLAEQADELVRALRERRAG